MKRYRALKSGSSVDNNLELRLYVPEDASAIDDQSAATAHARNAATELISRDPVVAEAVANWATLSQRKRRGITRFAVFCQDRPLLEKAAFVLSANPWLVDSEVAAILGVRRETLSRSLAYREVKRRRRAIERELGDRKYREAKSPSLRIYRPDDDSDDDGFDDEVREIT